MTVGDHQAQLDRIDQDGRRLGRLQRYAERFHRVANIILLIAAIFVLAAAVELFVEPTNLRAMLLIGELVGVMFHFVLSGVASQIMIVIDKWIARLRYELQIKADELMHLADGLGLNRRRNLAP